MKRILTILAATLLIAAPAVADEGMWLLPLLKQMNGKAMANLGCRLSPEEIYSINSNSLKDAIVHFGGGCTGELISGEGLVVTNHHCGYGYIQALSSTEHNYLEDGYWAKSLEEELPAPGLTVTFLKSMTDITPIIEALRDEEVEATKKVLIEQAEKDNPNCRAQITGFYNDNVYYLIVSKVYRDVRFVGAPPASSGKFGGDTDNWMWPRHTCDFSMFRVYADENNEPADYSENNRPYKPQQFLKVSLKGYQDGDFAMIMGYPGRTQRFQTAAELEQMMTLNRIRVDARTVRQDVMWKEMRADDKVGLQYASKYSSSSNGWKKWQGEELAFKKLSIIEREEQKEADFQKWAGKNKKRTQKYGSALSQIREGVTSFTEPYKEYTLLTETIYDIEVMQASVILYSGFNAAILKNLENKEPLDSAAAMEAGFGSLEKFYKDYNAGLDRKVADAVYAHYKANTKSETPVELDVEELFASSAFTSLEKARGSIRTLEDIKADPAFKLYMGMIDELRRYSPAISDGKKAMKPGQKAFTAGLLEWKKGEPSYPDANSTMRLTYGSVKSYSPRDGVLYNYYTTLKGVMEKEDPANYEFRVPAALKDIYLKKDFGQYAMENGQVPACFLINCDITGGNSGSPVMDADGNLIGLAFDGNWESMSSDVMFEPDLQRCICVDIRYVLLMMDKFGGAGYLLKEMALVK